jgi:small subunit ribosomal protein S20
MPNTKSAGRRMRNSARKQTNNRSTHSRLHSLEKKYLDLVESGKKDDAAKAYKTVISALDKAAKIGAVPKSRASRKKSRLAIRLNKIKTVAA